MTKVQTVADISKDSLAEILGHHFGDKELKIVTMGEVEGMGGVNDGMNSAMCKLHVRDKSYLCLVTCPGAYNPWE